MAAAGFGRRGLPKVEMAAGRRVMAPVPSTATVPEVSPSPRSVRDLVTAPVPEEDGLRRMLEHFPVVTLGLILFLHLVFAAEKLLAIDMGPGGAVGLDTLIAMGGVNADMALADREVWRFFLAPLLHMDAWHLFGNCFALAFVGMRLEYQVGHRWFAFIFVFSALGGDLGSIPGNDASLTSVGASGAITGLIGALFVVSFRPGLSADDQWRLMKTAMKFGVPALAPLAFGASGHVDYFCHLGGGLAGALAGLVVLVCGWEAEHRPVFAGLVGKVAVGGLVLAVVSAGVAALHFGGRALDPKVYMTQILLPTTEKDILAKAGDLVRRFPRDPRAHVYRGVSYLKDARIDQAEDEFRQAMTLAGVKPDPRFGPVADMSRTYIAVIMQSRGQTSGARDMARDLCAGKPVPALIEVLNQAKLCGKG